jgi:hypothetical protein
VTLALSLVESGQAGPLVLESAVTAMIRAGLTLRIRL